MPNMGYHGNAVVSDTVSTSLVGPNPNRVAIVISSGPTNRITLNMGGIAALDAGINIHPLSSPLILDKETYGDAITNSINAISAVASQTIGFYDVIIAP